MAKRKKLQPTKKEERKVSSKEEKVETKEKEPVKKTVSKEIKKESPKELGKEIRVRKARRKSFLASLLVTIVLLAVVSASLFPILKATKFGLDLQGGFEILYKVDSVDGSKVTQDMVTSTYNIILKRIDILGVSEPEISIEGNNIRVGLAGVTDESEAKNTLSKMANLTFRDTSDNFLMDGSVLKAGSVKVAQNPDRVGTYMLLIDISDVDTFYQKTKPLIGKEMVIWLDFEEGVDSYAEEVVNCGTSGDSRCISHATIQGELTGGSVQLTGNFTQEEAQDLADLINSGSLPTKLEEFQLVRSMPLSARMLFKRLSLLALLELFLLCYY